MKFHWFHLMAYPYLPDDFKQRYPSVWVTPPAAVMVHCACYSASWRLDGQS